MLGKTIPTQIICELRPRAQLLEDPDFFEVPSSWLSSARKVAQRAASLILVELCCEEGSALSRACSNIPEVAYFGVTKEVDLLSYNGLRLLQEVFGVLSYGTVRVYAHLSTPCSAGCGLRHLRFKKGGKALEKWRAALAETILEEDWKTSCALWTWHDLDMSLACLACLELAMMSTSTLEMSLGILEEVCVALSKCVAASQLFRRPSLRSFRESTRLEQSGCTLACLFSVSTEVLRSIRTVACDSSFV